MNSETRFMVQIALAVLEVVIGLFCGQAIGYGIFEAQEFGGSVWTHIQMPVFILILSCTLITTLILTLPRKK